MKPTDLRGYRSKPKVFLDVEIGGDVVSTTHTNIRFATHLLMFFFELFANTCTGVRLPRSAAFWSTSTGSIRLSQQRTFVP